MIRTFEQKQVEDLAKYGSIPIINALTDFAHPCQVLADLMTIRERKGALEGLKACYIGDGNNMMHSIIVGCLKMGMSISVACPEGYRPDKEVLDFASQYEGFQIDKILKLLQKMQMCCLQMYGHLWARKVKLLKEERRLKVTKSMLN